MHRITIKHSSEKKSANNVKPDHRHAKESLTKLANIFIS